MDGRFALIGAPTSAGTHHAGQEQAPSALRGRHLVQRLRNVGVDLVDTGDIAGETWAADSIEATARNITAVVRVAEAVAEAVRQHSATGRTPIVVGGDCTITLGVVAGLQRAHDDVRVLYFDGDADLSSPDRTGSGVLDATGVAHLLGIAETPLGRIGTRHPMLDQDQIALLGPDSESLDDEALTARPRLMRVSDAELRRDPAGCARRAVEAITDDDAAIVVHFDVDAVDSRDLPLANYPHYGTGVLLEAVRDVLRVLLRAKGLAAVVLTEVNPTHDPDGKLLDRYIDALAAAFD